MPKLSKMTTSSIPKKTPPMPKMSKRKSYTGMKPKMTTKSKKKGC